MSSGRCTICQETFDPTEISALKCGHTFHLHCVSQWLQKSSSCPVCRRSVNKSTELVEQLFFDVGEDSAVFSSPSPAANNKKVNELIQQVRVLESEVEKTTAAAKRANKEAYQSEQANIRLDAENRTLKAQLGDSRAQARSFDIVRAKNGKELMKMRMELEKLLDVKKLINDQAGNIDYGSMDVTSTAMGIMKRKYDELSKEKSILVQQVKEKDRETTMLKKENQELGVQLQGAKQQGETSKAASKTTDDRDLWDTFVVMEDDSGDDDSQVFNMPPLKTTNMALRFAALRSKQVSTNIVTKPSAATSTILGRKTVVPVSRAKPTTTSGKRFDGFGGHASTSMAAKSTASTAAKRKAAVSSKGAKKPVVTKRQKTALTATNQDDDVVVLSD